MEHGDEQFTGKYEASGRIGGWLIDNFYTSVLSLLASQSGVTRSILEVGCGAGYSTQRIRERIPAATTLEACDISDSLVEKARMRNPGVPVSTGSVYGLSHADASVDGIVMLEVLEHLDEPQKALRELHRVCEKYVVLSTPREPVWRGLNMARGRYLRDFGNTPGHVQHWSSRALRREVSTRFDVLAMRQPLPWTVLLLAPKR